MIGHIYYGIGLLVAFSILSIILRFRKIYSTKEWAEKYEKVTGKAFVPTTFTDEQIMDAVSVSFEKFCTD